MGNVGTVNRVVINGVTYDVPADINITFNRAGFTIEDLPTSGKTLFKYVRKTPSMENVILSMTEEEMEELNNVAETLSDCTLAVELASGYTYRTTGRISFENWESETGRGTVKFLPNKTKNAWTPTPA
jgi:hypothetical protein